MLYKFFRCSALLAVCLICASPVLAQNASELFDDSVLHDIWIEVQPQDWQALQETYQENNYYRATFRWKGLSANNIGIRSRGNGSRSPIKPGLRIDFNRYDAKARFLGLKTLILRNLVQDASGLHEKLSMQMLDRVGIPAPLESFARLYVNGEYYGLYTMAEDIDIRFIGRKFGEDMGPLYEYRYWGGFHFEDMGNDPASYSPIPFEPKANEKQADPKMLMALMQAVCKPANSDYVNAISRHIDPKKFLLQVAVESYLGELDGLMGEVGMNNFYLYRFIGTQRFQFIPWDRDASFGDPSISVFHNMEKNVLAARLLAIPEMRRYFLTCLWEAGKVAGGPGGWLDKEALRHINLIHGALLADSKTPFPQDYIEESLAAVRWFIEFRFDFVQQALLAEGFPPLPLP